MQKNKSIIINMGCRLNIYEGEIIRSHLKKNNLSNFTVINSCAVTENAEKKVRYEIRKAKKRFPNKKIVLTGCAAQIFPQKYSKIKEVDYLIGNIEKINSQTWSNINDSNPVQVKNIFKSDKAHYNVIKKFEGKARAYIEIQQGCDHRCTFCIIPYGRGNNRSVPVGEIINRINTIVNNGYKEVVLTGVDITDYGKDLPGKPNLFQLVKRILNLVPELHRLRLSSIDCAEISDDFWNILPNPRLMPHLHLSLQSGNNMILKRMKRRHTREQAINFCNQVLEKRNDVVFGADIIAGFPTETSEMFNDSVRLIDECNLTHLHIFPFSSRSSTPAAKMPQLPKKTILDRAKKLRVYGEKKLEEYLKNQIGNKTSMLVEKSDKSKSFGKTKHFTKISLDQNIPEGSLVNCEIYTLKNNILHAKLV